MAHSIGKTIAELRKAKGWTQVELAEKLGVSDKAVSKWESEGGYPEITQLPVLASIFDITIDFLLTGKNPTIISLDDMDNDKRLIYLIRKDDAETFKKYGYHTHKLPKEAILEILNNKSINIFKILESTPEHLSINRDANITPVGRVYEYIDEFVKLACLSGSIAFLDYINIKAFAIGEANYKDNIYCGNYKPAYKENTAYRIKPETIEFIFNDKNVPESIIDYMSSYRAFNRQYIYQGGSYDYNKMNLICYNMTLEVIKQLYKTQRYSLLEKLVEELRVEVEKLRTALGENRIISEQEYTSQTRIIPFGSFFIIDYTYSSRFLGKAVTFPQEFIYFFAYYNDKKWLNLFVNHNRNFNTLNISDVLKAYAPSKKEIDELLMKAAKDKRIEAIKSNLSISEHERRCRLAEEGALSLADAIVSDDYDAFVLLPETERNKIDPEYLSRNNVQDIRFYIYAVNVSDNAEYLNKGLKNILENYPERYDIQDVLLSAGAIIDGNIAMTNILKQNVLILNKQANVDNSDVEVNESVSKQQLLEKIEANQLQYVIVNATIQMEKKLKVLIVEQGVDLAVMIDKALSMGLIDEFTCKLLHKLRMARNGIMHAGNKYHYTAEIVKMWVEAVYSIK